MKIGLIKTLIKLLWNKLLRPIAKDYVEQTDNTWDDQALKFVDELVNLFMSKIDSVVTQVQQESEKIA